MSNISIRKSQFGDFENIKSLMLTALKEDPTAFSVDFDEYANNGNEWWNSYISPYLFSLKDKMYLAFDNSDLVGMIGIIYDYKKRRSHVASVVWLFVKSNYRGLGIGSDLIVKVIEDGKANKISKITLLVNSSQTSAIKLYQKHGFIQNGKLVKELNINGEFLDTIIMELFLDQIA